jgi:hypothetical protein
MFLMSRLIHSFFIKERRFKTALNDRKNYPKFKLVINLVLSCHSPATQNQNLINKKLGEKLFLMSRLIHSFFIKPRRFKTALNDRKNYSEFKLVINFVLS